MFGRLILLVALALGVAGCDQGQESGSRAPDDVGDGDAGAGGAPESAECAAPSDCVLAASTCCECASFAVPATSDFADGCAAVDCPPIDGCAAVVATCDTGSCELACAPVVTAQQCPGGFQRDALGCLLDACAAAPDPTAAATCDEAADCAQVAADCCGCARGGADTAATAAEAALLAGALGCTGAESCPEVDVCDPTAAPLCVAGRCALVALPTTDGVTDLALCGTPDYPACGPGEVCVLNGEQAKDAASLGVGRCQLP